MTDIRIIDQVAVISRRLRKLGEKYKAAGNDHQLSNEIQAEIAELMKLKEKLVSAPAKRPPGIAARPVR